MDKLTCCGACCKEDGNELEGTHFGFVGWRMNEFADCVLCSRRSCLLEGLVEEEIVGCRSNLDTFILHRPSFSLSSCQHGIQYSITTYPPPE